MNRSLALAALIALTNFACSAPSAEEAESGAGAASCGAPEDRTPLEPTEYVLTSRPAEGLALVRLRLDAETKKFSATLRDLKTDEDRMLKGGFSIITPRCQTSSRNLFLNGGEEDEYSFYVSPNGEGGLVFEHMVEGSPLFEKFTMEPVVFAP